MIAEKAEISGSGKSARGWFTLDHANVTYDHPFHLSLDHALSIDFVNEAAGPDARVAVELTPQSARRLVEAMLAALERDEEATGDTYVQ